jgi:hypothetical protein
MFNISGITASGDSLRAQNMNHKNLNTHEHGGQRLRTDSQSINPRPVFSAAFSSGAWIVVTALLLSVFATVATANVIQANQSYPPPNGSFRSPGPDYNFGSGATAVQIKDMAFTFFDNFVLIAGPTPSLSFTAQCSHRISVDGGVTWSGEQAATANFTVSLTAPVGDTYTFGITSLTISGGDLPAGFQLQYPGGPLPGTPTPPTATFTPNTPSPGLFSIDTIFYLPLELSQDGGGTWTANSVSGVFGTPAFVLSPLTSEEVSHAPTLPPGDGNYYTPDQYHAAFASGIVIRNPIHNGFLGRSCTDVNTSGQPGLTNVLCPPPILGGTSTEDFDSQMSFDLLMPGLVHVGPIGASVETQVTHQQDFGSFQIFRAQMMQLNPNPGTLPAGLRIRLNPDPNKPSLGMVTMRPGSGPNDTNIASAFALRIQLSTDNGATWQDSDQFTHMQLRIPPGEGFPVNAPTNGQTFSIGVCEFVVDPSFAFLFAPSNSSSYYPGYAGPASGILTGPVMYDGNTLIGESVSHVRPASAFPVAVGTPNQYPPNTLYSNVYGYSDYALIPPPFANMSAGVDEIFTEIEQMNLQGYANKEHSNGVACSDPRVPSVTSQSMGQLVTVKAGPGAFGIGPSLPMNRRSIGIVQQTTLGPDDFPAQSFFNIYVEINLPRVPGTVADYVFPAAGAMLYNDANNPLLIENLSLMSLPPEATYVHGQTTAVPVRFKYNNPPYWSADDVLGFLTLAGHGVFTNVVTASAPCAAAVAAGGLLDQTLGPVGSPMPAPPIPWLRLTNTFPTPNFGYASVVNRPVDLGTTNILDDQIIFSSQPLGFVVTVRDLSLSSFAAAIPPPPPLASALFASPGGTLLSCEVSIWNGSSTGFYPVTSNPANSVLMTISNTAAGNPAIYDTELQGLAWFGSIIGGAYDGMPLALRESPSKASLGKHTIAPDPRGYRVSSFFDVWLELSLDDGITWLPANKAFRLHSAMPPPIPQTVFVTHATRTNLVIEWQNNFQLQTATNVSGPWTDVKGPNGSIRAGPYTNNFNSSQRFFRMRQ